MLRTIGAAIAGAALFAGAASAQTYSIGTNPQGSVFYAAGTAISRVMVEKTGLQFRVQPYAGSSTYMPLIDQGKLAFGMANVGEAAFASSGTEIYRQPMPNLRMVAITFNNVSGFVVRKDSPIKSIKDLKGKTVPVGFTSGRIFHYIMNGALATEGMTDKDLNGVPTPNFVAGMQLFMSGRADAAFTAVPAGITQQANATIEGGVRFLSTPCDDEAAAKFDKWIPGGVIGKMEPGESRPFITENPTCFTDVPFTVVTGAHVPDEVVYKVVKTMAEHKADLGKALGAFNRMEIKGMAAKHPVPYHPGALKAYTELGIPHS